jgi:hypothetical protein
MFKVVTGIISLFSLLPIAIFSNGIDSNITSPTQMQDTIISRQIVPEPDSYDTLDGEDPADNPLTDPGLQAFTSQVTTGQQQFYTGVYVDQDLNFSIAQQPSGNAGYISSTDGVITEFRLAKDYGSIGLLAHNYLAGEQFSELGLYQQVVLVRGDGQLQLYTIVKIERYQALSPTSPYSNFLNLDDQDQTLTAADLFYHVYDQDNALVFQTCIEKDGEWSWGRLFITAMPSANPIGSAP